MPINFVSADPNFCGLCGAILPLPTAAPQTVPCKLCKTNWMIKEKQDHLVYRIEKIYERTVADTDEMEKIEGEAQDAVVDHLCPKCGHNKASYATMQTRSADEGQTVFYTCLKCKRKDIEYS